MSFPACGWNRKSAFTILSRTVSLIGFLVDCLEKLNFIWIRLHSLWWQISPLSNYERSYFWENEARWWQPHGSRSCALVSMICSIPVAKQPFVNGRQILQIPRVGSTAESPGEGWMYNKTRQCMYIVSVAMPCALNAQWNQPLNEDWQLLCCCSLRAYLSAKQPAYTWSVLTAHSDVVTVNN